MIQTEDGRKIFKIVLTGGPCAGKTSMFEPATRFFEDLGYEVIMVPEAATELMASGMRVGESETIESFQTKVARFQIKKENEALNKAVGKLSLIICDRGILDGKAYCLEDGQFARILSNLGTDIETASQAYDGVVHLSSAACGSHKFYNHDNEERKETILEAQEKDRLVWLAWHEHPGFKTVGNSDDFKEKIDDTLKKMNAIIEQSRNDS